MHVIGRALRLYVFNLTCIETDRNHFGRGCTTVAWAKLYAMSLMILEVTDSLERGLS